MLRIEKIFPDSILPNYATEGSVGLDLYSYENNIIKKRGLKGIIFASLNFCFKRGH
jgi:dUTPase